MSESNESNNLKLESFDVSPAGTDLVIQDFSCVGGVVRMRVVGPVGATAVLQASGNLAAWAGVQTNQIPAEGSSERHRRALRLGVMGAGGSESWIATLIERREGLGIWAVVVDCFQQGAVATFLGRGAVPPDLGEQGVPIPRRRLSRGVVNALIGSAGREIHLPRTGFL